MTRPLIAGAFAIAAIAAIVAGLAVIDPPGLAREKRMDERRESDLLGINYAIERYYRLHDTLPARLEDTDPGIVPNDPETDAPYRYEITDDGYRLCATFRHPGEQAGSAVEFPGRNFGRHGAGDHCFPLPPPEADTP